jgi:hypothetical protein
MGLRRNRALKFFAILLFSFEMIAPALLASGSDNRQGNETRVYSNDGGFINFISSLLCEENNGEEEERESKDHKSPFIFSDFIFHDLSAGLTINETRQTSWAKPHETTSSQPSRFTLFHTYLI